MDSILLALQAHGLKRREQITENFQSKNISGKLIKAKEGKSDLDKANQDTSGDHWITVNGRHILISGAGEVKQGGKGMADGNDLERVNSAKPKNKDKFRPQKSKFTKPDKDKNYPKGSKKFDSGDSFIAERTAEHSKSGKSDEEAYAAAKEDYKQKHGKDYEPAAKDFENTYSADEAKKYAEGGVPTPTKKKEIISADEVSKHILPMVDDIIRNGMFSNRKEATQYAREYYLENKHLLNKK